MKKFTILSLILLAVTFIAGCTATSPEIRSARIAMNERDWDRAIRNAREELEIRPQSPEAYFIIGAACEMKKDWFGMAENYALSLKNGNQYADRIQDSRMTLMSRFVKAATVAYDSSRFSDAFANIDTALVIMPEDITLYINAAVIAYQAGDREKSELYARKAISLETGIDPITGDSMKPDQTMREILLIGAQERNDTAEAYRVAQELMNLIDPTQDRDSYITALDAIISYWEGKAEAVKVDTSATADTVKVKAALDEIKGYHDKAILVIEKAIALYPDLLQLKINLAVLLDRVDRPADSEAIYKELIAADPDNQIVNTNLAYMLLEQGKYAEAIPMLEKVHKADPKNITVVRNLMAAYYNSDQDDLGKEMADKLKALTGAE